MRPPGKMVSPNGWPISDRAGPWAPTAVGPGDCGPCRYGMTWSDQVSAASRMD